MNIKKGFIANHRFRQDKCDYTVFSVEGKENTSVTINITFILQVGPEIFGKSFHS